MVTHAKYTQAEKLQKFDTREFDRMLARFAMGCKVTKYRSLGFIQKAWWHTTCPEPRC
jgi:hypothetical protein